MELAASSSWLEGGCCELVRFGHSRDGKKGKLQIVYGLLCAADGCPVAVEVLFPCGEHRRRWDYLAGLIDGGARPAVRSSTMI